MEIFPFFGLKADALLITPAAFFRSNEKFTYFSGWLPREKPSSLCAAANSLAKGDMLRICMHAESIVVLRKLSTLII